MILADDDIIIFNNYSKIFVFVVLPHQKEICIL